MTTESYYAPDQRSEVISLTISHAASRLPLFEGAADDMREAKRFRHSGFVKGRLDLGDGLLLARAGEGEMKAGAHADRRRRLMDDRRAIRESRRA